MAKLIQYRRLFWLAFLLGIGFLSLGYRLVDLQVRRHEELTFKAQQQTQRRYYREPRRGDIRDCRGNLLAKSVFVKTVCADPMWISNRTVEVARALAPLLGVNGRWLTQRLEPQVRVNRQGEARPIRYVALKHNVTAERWEAIATAMRNLSFGVAEERLPSSERRFYQNLRRKAIFVDEQEDQLRVYPHGRTASHVLGFVGTEECQVDEHVFRETTGRYGIELALNSQLSGVRGWRETAKNRRGIELLTMREQDVEPRDGLDVVLTLDLEVQNIVEQELAAAFDEHSPVSISAIVMRPRTGAILAMANLPDFDPNAPGASPPAFLRNRTISDLAEPGSTFKIVVVAAALNEGIVTLDECFDCEQGRFLFAGRILGDHEHFGILSVKQIITKSSNIGAAKIGIRLGPEKLYDYMIQFGFGQPTGIVLGQGAEVRGIVHPVEKWSGLSISRIPMGHEVAVTPLQMTFAMAALANHGWLMRPMLVDRLENEHGEAVTQFCPHPLRQVVSERTAQQMVATLKTVVSPEGTAPKAALEHYVVAGKTGTAQKIVNGRYVHDKHFASFIGFFPADDPELCISVVMDDPQKGYYGGQIAAPVFKRIAERAANYLNVRPDALSPGELAWHENSSRRRTASRD